MLGQKLSDLRNELKLNKKGAAQLLGIPYTTYVNYENGTREPNLEMLRNIASAFSVSVDYLLDLTPDRLAGEKILDFQEEQLLNAFRSLSEYGKSAVLGMTGSLSGYEKAQNRQSIKNIQHVQNGPGVHRIKLYNLPVSAGPGEFLQGEDYSLLDFSPGIPQETDFALRISGDSMEPLYRDGSIIYLKKCESVDSGQIGVFLLNGSAYLKRFLSKDGDVSLVSLNPKYPPIRILESDAFSCVGKVLKS